MRLAIGGKNVGTHQKVNSAWRGRRNCSAETVKYGSNYSGKSQGRRYSISRSVPVSSGLLDLSTPWPLETQKANAAAVSAVTACEISSSAARCQQIMSDASSRRRSPVHYTTLCWQPVRSWSISYCHLRRNNYFVTPNTVDCNAVEMTQNIAVDGVYYLLESTRAVPGRGARGHGP